MHSNEDREKMRSAIEWAKKFMIYGYECYTPQKTRPDKKYSFANGTWKTNLMNDRRFYEDDKIYIRASPPFDGSEWWVEISVVRRSLFSRKYELVCSGDIYSESSVFRVGMWIDYVKTLGQWAEGRMNERKEKTRIEALNRREEAGRQRKTNNMPIDDSSIFGK